MPKKKKEAAGADRLAPKMLDPMRRFRKKTTDKAPSPKTKRKGKLVLPKGSLVLPGDQEVLGSCRKKRKRDMTRAALHECEVANTSITQFDLEDSESEEENDSPDSMTVSEPGQSDNDELPSLQLGTSYPPASSWEPAISCKFVILFWGSAERLHLKRPFRVSTPDLVEDYTRITYSQYLCYKERTRPFQWTPEAGKRRSPTYLFMLLGQAATSRRAEAVAALLNLHFRQMKDITAHQAIRKLVEEYDLVPDLSLSIVPSGRTPEHLGILSNAIDASTEMDMKEMGEAECEALRIMEMDEEETEKEKRKAPDAEGQLQEEHEQEQEDQHESEMLTPDAGATASEIEPEKSKNTDTQSQRADGLRADDGTGQRAAAVPAEITRRGDHRLPTRRVHSGRFAENEEEMRAADLQDDNSPTADRASTLYQEETMHPWGMVPPSSASKEEKLEGLYNFVYEHGPRLVKGSQNTIIGLSRCKKLLSETGETLKSHLLKWDGSLQSRLQETNARLDGIAATLNTVVALQQQLAGTPVLADRDYVGEHQKELLKATQASLKQNSTDRRCRWLSELGVHAPAAKPPHLSFPVETR